MASGIVPAAANEQQGGPVRVDHGIGIESRCERAAFGAADPGQRLREIGGDQRAGALDRGHVVEPRGHCGLRRYGARQQHHARGRKRREDQERDEQLDKGEALLGGTPRRRETASHPARLAIVSVAGKPLAPRTAISILSTPPPSACTRRAQCHGRPPLVVVPALATITGGTGSVSVSIARLRATACATTRRSRSAAVRSVTPCSRRSASAARLNTASATSLSINVKPFSAESRQKVKPFKS